MKNRIIRMKNISSYRAWIEQNNYSILSTRHRGFYAEMAFKKYCLEQGILALPINAHLPILEQIPHHYLKKSQQKELKNIGKIPFKWFCVKKSKGYFVALKMGTSALSSLENHISKWFSRNKAYLFRVFEDGEALLKKL